MSKNNNGGRMKKWLLFVLFIPQVSFGAVTQAQAQQARAAATELMQAAQAMMVYASQVNALFDAGFTLTVAGSTETVTIPQATQDKLIDVAKYQALKNNLVTSFNKLP